MSLRASTALLLGLTSLCGAGCASNIVHASDLPLAPYPEPRGKGSVVLLLASTPRPMAEAVRAFATGMGPTREAETAPDEPLRSACAEPTDLVLRPRVARTHFASNAPDRNTLFIYETAIIVGIPVTLVSAVAWPYYAETVVEGELEVLECSEEEPRLRVDSFRLRSEGRGFVRTHTLRDAQLDGAASGVTRKLLTGAFE